MLDRMLHRAAGALVALAILQGEAVLAQAEISPTWPDWLVKDMARETLVREAFPLSLADKRFVGRMPGTPLEQRTEDEDSWYVASDLGDAGVMECWVFDTEQDPATLSSELGQLLIQTAAGDAPQPPAAQVYDLDAGHLDGRPYYALEWLYTLGTPPEARIGLVKLRTALVGDFTLSCAHNHLGYRQTFGNLFQQLVGSLSVKSASTEPYYQELFIQSIAGRRIGFSLESFRLDPEGDTEVVSIESMILPVDASSLTASDTWRKSFSNPDGSMINAYVYSAENGEVVTDMSLAWGDKQWQVSGSLMGKAFSGVISAENMPMSSLGFFHGMRELMRDPDATVFEYRSWMPSVDPTSFITATVTVDKPDNNGTLQTGPLIFQGEFGSEGTVESMAMNMGGISMLLERAWHRGDLPGN